VGAVERSCPRALVPAIAVCLGLLLALAAGELSLRLIALVSPDVRYFSTARADRPGGRPANLEAYLAGRPEQIIPYRQWFNHWTNALGFNDEEFVVPKPAGRFRIMAVGDSFTYGLVPYPQSVMTLLESFLRAACPARDLDLLNFGIGATGVHEYRTLVELASATYEPDLVLINFYAGNDGPRQGARGRGPLRALLGHSYLWTYTGNALSVRWSVPDPGALATSAGRPAPADRPPAERPSGGRVIDPGHRLREDDPALAGPTFEEAAYTEILASELRQLHVPGDAGAVGRAWGPTLAELEAARAHVAQRGGRLVITLYPSVLQVDARLRTALIDRLRGRRRHAELTSDTIDPWLPNRIVAEYCRAHGLSCFDLTPALIRASEESAGPLYKTRDAHWTVRGNRIAAEAQAEHLAPLVCAAPVWRLPRG
jgi:hypothetical protein